MSNVELFTGMSPHPGKIDRAARRAEDDGWQGITFADSQSMSSDPYVAMTIAACATTKIRLATGVTNPLTRHASITASASTSIDIESGGRAEIGIGRGDSSLAHIGRAPVSVRALSNYLAMLKIYLRGDGVPLETAAGADGPDLRDRVPLHDAPSDSRLKWLRSFKDHVPVPVGVVASGPRVIETAAEQADRVILAVGANPARVRWAINIAQAVNPNVRIGMYLNVVVDENIERGIALSAGGITSFARFSVLHGSVNGPVEDRVHTALEALPGEYQMSQHFHSGNRAADIAPSLASTFAIVGGPQYCIERLLEISALGVDRFYIVGPTRDADREGAKRAARRFVEFVLPKLATTS